MENTYREGHFVWRELMTTDLQKARGFYGELLGWTAEDTPMPTGTYTVFKKEGVPLAGMMAMPPGATGMPPAWMSYCSVKDVDKTLEVATKNGGQVIMPAMDAAEVGRFAVLSDPTGGVLGVLRGTTGDGPTPKMDSVGHFCWETLNTTDVEKAKAFYTTVIGWTVAAGPGANMTIMSAGTSMVADFESAPPGVPSHWLLHVLVQKLEVARDRAERLGAKVLMPLIEIPQIGRMAIITDPNGAALSLYEPAPRPSA